MFQKIWIGIVCALFIASPLCGATLDDQALTVRASSERQWTGVAVDDQGRIFVNYPYWAATVPTSVAELVDGEPVPYPNPAWNNRKNPESFNAVQSVVIDSKNRLWVLDTNNPHFKGVEKAGPVLYQFDLKTNRKVKAFSFPEGVYRADSYFNDVRIDTKKEIAYITDSGNGALIVLNLGGGTSRRVLEGHPSVQSEVDLLVCNGRVWENRIDADGIALSDDGEYLYYIALTSHTLYRIRTAALTDETLASEELCKKVETVATVPATDGILFDRKGNLWMGALESNGVNMLDKDGNLHRVFQSPAIRWADSFAMGSNGDIYFTTSQIHLPPKDRGLYQLLSFNPQGVLKKQKNK